eukprot:1485060-Amphidinium_carterae.1
MAWLDSPKSMKHTRATVSHRTFGPTVLCAIAASPLAAAQLVLAFLSMETSLGILSQDAGSLSTELSCMLFSHLSKVPRRRRALSQIAKELLSCPDDQTWRCTQTWTH